MINRSIKVFCGLALSLSLSLALCVCVFFLNKFIHNMLHYRVILHVLVDTLLQNDLSITVW